MKKYFVVLFLFVSALLLTSCDEDPVESEFNNIELNDVSGTDDEEEEQNPDPPKGVG